MKTAIIPLAKADFFRCIDWDYLSVVELHASNRSNALFPPGRKVHSKRTSTLPPAVVPKPLRGGGPEPPKQGWIIRNMRLIPYKNNSFPPHNTDAKLCSISCCKKGKQHFFSENICRGLLPSLFFSHFIFSHSVALFSQFLPRKYIFSFS